MFTLNCLLVSEIFKYFPHRVLCLTMSADGSHLGWRSGSTDISLKGDNPRTIHAMFALNCIISLRGEDFKIFFLIGSYVKTMFTDGSHLGWRLGHRTHFES